VFIEEDLDVVRLGGRSIYDYNRGSSDIMVKELGMGTGFMLPQITTSKFPMYEKRILISHSSTFVLKPLCR
jgi:hypothetical protein